MLKNNRKALTHELISSQAAETPSALAVCDENRQLTFAELEGESNRLAQHLQSLGVGAEVPVGLYFDRSVDFVIAALAVLRAGGAYVPLDTSYPPVRTATILRDSGARVLLSHKWMAAGLAGGPWKTVDMNVDAAAIRECSAELPLTVVTGERLAYVIYTSGSTGRPKGVEVTHGNLSHLVRWHHKAFDVGANDRASQIAGLAFDASVWEIWCNLTAGASLHLVDDTSRRSAEKLRDWLLARKITIAFAPTAIAEQLIDFDWPNSMDLRVLLTGADTLRRHPKEGLPFVLVNNYGPTECTVLVTSGRVDGSVRGQLPTIGRPIDDMEISTTDDGEICVAGPQVARGYRNLPELTAQKFTTEAGKRLYRTGDRGRILPDGQIAFLGRIDDQIKIRGYRVEPDEVISALNSHPGIRTGTVIARGETAEEKALVAYVVYEGGSQLNVNEIREFLRERLPDYMIPAEYVSLSALPLTNAGKVDKKALPAPLVVHTSRTSAQTRGGGGTEAVVAKLVSGLMNGKAVTREDNFFLIGGHSMLAAQLLARLRENLAVNLSLRQLFEAPTVALLAAAVEAKLAVQ